MSNKITDEMRKAVGNAIASVPNMGIVFIHVEIREAIIAAVYPLIRAQVLADVKAKLKGADIYCIDDALDAIEPLKATP